MQKQNRVSLYESRFAKECSSVKLEECLTLIKGESFKWKVERCRQLLDEKDQEGYSREKNKLSAFTFCASYEGNRVKENLREYNQLVILKVLMNSKKL